MLRVIIESPYAGTTKQINRNLTYLRRALRDSLLRGEAPFASHGLYTQPGVLDDADTAERVLGMAAGFAWIAHADFVAVYKDLGITSGMEAGIARAHYHNLSVIFREIGP